MALVLWKLKNFVSIIFDFFNTKLGKAIGLILIAFFCIWYIDHRAYNKGIEYQKNINQQAYVEKLKEKEKVQEEVAKDAVVIKEERKQIKKKHKENKAEVEAITKKYEDIKMSDDDYGKFTEKLESIK